MNKLKLRFKKGVVSFTAISMMMLMAAGCSNTKTETSTTAKTTNTQAETSTQTEDTTASSKVDSSANSEAAPDATEDNGISGEVTAVNGSEITISVNKGGGAPKGDKPDGTAPDAASGSTTTDSTDTESDASTDTSSSNTKSSDSTATDTQASQGQAPSGDDAQKPERTSEEKVITIDDESIIYVKDGDSETQGSLADITVGKMVHITYTTDDSGNQVMEKITVQDMTQMPTGDKPSGDAKTSTEESTSTESTTETTN